MGDERIRLVIIGGPEVGKSGIVKRFLFNQYTDRYKATVEDLYNREFDLGPVTIKVYTVWTLSVLILLTKSLDDVVCSTKYLLPPVTDPNTTHLTFKYGLATPPDNIALSS